MLPHNRFRAVVGILAVLAVAGCAPAATQPAVEPTAGQPLETAGPSESPQVELCIESWRMDDLAIWQETILPVFEAQHPNISVTFRPVVNTEYSSTLATKIEAGTACDLIMVEPFDFRLSMYENGDLANLNDLPALDNFSDLALSAWSTDDGSEHYAVPLASVIHGFIYNADIFEELGLREPETIDEFHSVLQAVAEDGRYTPLAMGTADYFVPGLLGFQLIGPNYWRGEEGRTGLIAGTEKFTDPQYVSVWQELATWGPFMPSGYEGIGYSDMQNLFIMGKAAVYPAGSWEISIFNSQIGDRFRMGAFKPPVVSSRDQCYVNDHMDMGMALNAHAQHPSEAREFLNWLGTAEFARLWNAALPGFFSLSNYRVEIDDPLAQEFLSWRFECQTTFRSAYKILSRSEVFNTDTEINRVTALVMNGTMTPEEAARTIQTGLASWYEPQRGQ